MKETKNATIRLPQELRIGLLRMASPSIKLSLTQ